MEFWLQCIKEVGFPIAVTLYLLNRIESKLDMVITSIKELPNELYQPSHSTKGPFAN
jgi:hypothetical protein